MLFEGWDPEFPHWVHQVLRSGGCPHCGGKLAEHHITGLGVQVPGYITASNRRPQGRVVIQCPNCGQEIAFDITVEPSQIVAAVEVLADYIVHDEPDLNVDDDEDDDVTLPSPNYPTSSGAKYTDSTDADGDDPTTDERSSEEKRMDAIQRRRKVQLKKTPSEREVEVFRNKLKRISFKRSSKSWREFLHKLGIDPDEPDGGLHDVNK